MHYPDLRSRFSLFEPRALVPRPYYYAPAIPPSIGFSNTVRGHSIAADKRPNNPRIVTPMNGGKEPRARVNRGCQGLRESARDGFDARRSFFLFVSQASSSE